MNCTDSGLENLRAISSASLMMTAFGVRGTEGFWGSILVAIVGAVILLTLIRLLIPRPRRV